VNYSNAEDFNLWLGTGTDGLYIDSTHAGTTDVFMGDGNATVNQRDDTVAIRSIGGTTTVHGEDGNDFFYVGVQPAVNDATFFTQFKAAAAAAANEDLFNALFPRTNVNGIGGVLNLHGEGDTDKYTVSLAGEGDALINVLDNGAPDDGVDTLIVNGSDSADTFLLRRDLVALLNTVVAGAFTHVERVNYDEGINARLVVNGQAGNDKFVVDDNSASPRSTAATATTRSRSARCSARRARRRPASTEPMHSTPRRSSWASSAIRSRTRSSSIRRRSIR
jgi:hypothetical protein